jgi:DHA1 family multidrug resistance protein-like MFS transporter
MDSSSTSDPLIEKRQQSTLAAMRRSIGLVSLPFFLLGLLLPIYGTEMGAGAVQIGLFFTAFSLMTVILRPLVGWALDRWGRRPFILAGFGGYALAMIAFAFINQWWGIIAARVIQGIASSLLWLSIYAATADLAGEDRRARSFGGISQASSQGSIVGAFIGMTILNWPFTIVGMDEFAGKWLVMFLFFGLAAGVAFFLALSGIKETRPVRPAGHVEQPIRWSRTWVLLLLVTFITGASWAMVSPVLIIFLRQNLNVEVGQLSWAFLPSGLVWAIFPVYLGRLADRFGRKPMMVLGLVMAAISSFVIPFLGSIVAFAAIWALQALCYAAGDPAEQALVADLTGGDQRGRAYGIYVMMADLGAAFGPLVGGWLYDSVGKGWPFYANGIVLGICAVLLLALLKEPGKNKATDVATTS